jgi:hypothetical protein
VTSLLSVLYAWLDYQRGADKAREWLPKVPALLGLGYLTAFFVGHTMDWQAAAITVSFAILHNALGVGEPLGHALTGKGGMTAPDGSVYEGWQKGWLLQKSWLAALTFRGAVLGLAGVAALDYTAAAHIAIAWGIAFPLAPSLVRFALRQPMLTTEQAGAAWSFSEWLRGSIAGLLLAVL